MRLTPDALVLGPLALSWSHLALLLGMLVFIWLAARRGMEGKAWGVLLSALLAARLGYAAEHLAAWPSLGAALLAALDIRTGGWNALAGLLAGALAAYLLLRREVVRLLLPAAASLAVSLVPLGLQQILSQPAEAASPDYARQVVQYLEPGQSRPREVPFGELPRPMLINFWATWCPPCRAEMPLLVEYQQKGYPVVLLNVGENPAVIQGFLAETGLVARVFLDSAGLQQAFRVSGLPTTLLVASDGQVVARHLGPLNRAQLEQLLQRLR
ncbi:MAG: TlpA family protein disulfide reductase [Meiothermus sp.]|uniref:TlpA family protein disulfide reductase n=1 Tax=Meiothermus sp. TaxID=1955249 RepID=UPI0025DE1383|nr:TlpA disulfide reductase family protein [Meiothermus sp.]MCS7194777.1 TlpA family protein disulfide reductase [Meiothermus sp.]MDW8091947.1 TlpA disulfide reductase family protein [Meiothermus sp.]MDW8480347.1 TlpA disulfide reductase family protein [Meiothermus sp.]